MDSPTEASSEQAHDERDVEEESAPSEREMPCPVCGHPMPDLKGGKESICPICGFKDSCCY
ncbi:MAG TPA: hypothetical protein VE258_17610 [Ktedonobacterales bacterium]|nr:hypothetical protein [Ktedonobacterales bacterium]